MVPSGPASHSKMLSASKGSAPRKELRQWRKGLGGENCRHNCVRAPIPSSFHRFVVLCLHLPFAFDLYRKVKTRIPQWWKVWMGWREVALVKGELPCPRVPLRLAVSSRGDPLLSRRSCHSRRSDSLCVWPSVPAGAPQRWQWRVKSGGRASMFPKHVGAEPTHCSSYPRALLVPLNLRTPLTLPEMNTSTSQK